MPAAQNQDTPRLRIKNVHKAFAVPVLRGIDLDIRPGQVHALVGENGAGKSTLCKILCGLVKPDQGQFHLDGEPYHPKNRKTADQAGIRMVQQELGIIGNLSVAENIFLDDLVSFRRWGLIDRKSLHQRARKLLADVGLADVSPDTPASALSVGQQQAVEIAAALARPCRVLIFDEPTAALTQKESEKLFEQTARLAAAGTAIIYISHRLEEVRRICDCITILRDGNLVHSAPAASMDIDEIVNFMVGTSAGGVKASNGQARPPADNNAERSVPLLRVRDIRVGQTVNGVSLDLFAGEILGIAGLMGAGRSELVRAIFGADRKDSGTVCLGNATQDAGIQNPGDAVKAGIALVTENRKEEGLFLPLSIRANLSLPQISEFSRRGPHGSSSGGKTWQRMLGLIPTQGERTNARQWAERLTVRCNDVEQPTATLSGGNQQKVLIARWLATNPQVLILDEPTRGIDVGARREIYRLLRQWVRDPEAKKPRTILIVSSDNAEVMQVCDRIAVMSLGSITATFDRQEEQDDRRLNEMILAAAFAGHQTPNQGEISP